MAYRTTIPVRFGDCDPAGIVYFPRFFNFFHGCFEDFFQSCVGVRYAQVIEKERVGFPTVHLEADFKVPLRQGDTTEVELTTLRVGGSSITCRYRVFNRDTHTLCGQSTITVAVVDLESMKSIPIPERYRQAFSAHLEH